VSNCKRKINAHQQCAHEKQESAHTLQRHAQRFPIGYEEDGINNERFAGKVSNFTQSSNSTSEFTGPLDFLNSYTYTMETTGLLTGLGAATEFSSGVQFWHQYGRTLFNATVGQKSYNASFENGPIVMRTTDQARIQNSEINWALGFFGPTYQTVANQELTNWTSPFELVIIPEGGTENNTLAAYDSCFNDFDPIIGLLGDLDVFTYIPKYLDPATKRLQEYVPQGFTLTTNDTYAMQVICAYEYNFLGSSDFCYLFTADEWAGFENTLDMACECSLNKNKCVLADVF
jgi:hypothetical protein